MIAIREEIRQVENGAWPRTMDLTSIGILTDTRFSAPAPIQL